MISIDKRLRDVLVSAYEPCGGFVTTCERMRWNPAAGHVPRGFCGATGSLEDVTLVLVVAEPGDPHDGEAHPSEPLAALESTYNYAYRCFRDSKDAFHRNVRHILSLCWPSLTFEDHMRRTWLTESVLCSAETETGPVPARIASACRVRHLERQLALFPQAVIATLGGKAAKRLAGLNIVAAGAAAPPGCNQPKVRESWKNLALEVQRRVV